MSKFGVLRVTSHLINHASWPDIENELKNVFIEQGRSFNVETSCWYIVGTSDLFSEVLEGTRIQCYVAVFKMVDGKPVFLEFQTEHQSILH